MVVRQCSLFGQTYTTLEGSFLFGLVANTAVMDDGLIAELNASRSMQYEVLAAMDAFWNKTFQAQGLGGVCLKVLVAKSREPQNSMSNRICMATWL